MSSVVRIACGRRHVAVITDVGLLLTWGEGKHGELGHGNLHGLGVQSKVSVPTVVKALGEKKAVDVACGSRHTAIITSGFELYTCGDPKSGALGLRKEKNRSRIGSLVAKRPEAAAEGAAEAKVAAASGKEALERKGSTTLPSSQNVIVPTLVEGLDENRPFCVAAGAVTTAFIDCTGTLFTAGFQAQGRLGRKGRNDVFLPVSHTGRVTQVECGNSHTIFMDNDMHVYAFGNNDNGQLGLGDLKNYSVGANCVERRL